MGEQSVENIGFAILAIMIVMGWVWYKLILSTVEKHHPATYARLGKPGILPFSSLKGEFSILRFITSREYRHLNNPSLSKLCDGYIAFFFFYAVYFIVFSYVIA